jgi:hypothetical protein
MFTDFWAKDTHRNFTRTALNNQLLRKIAWLSSCFPNVEVIDFMG